MIAGPLAALAPAAALWLAARADGAGAAVVWVAGVALWYAGHGPFLLLATVVALELAAAAAARLGADRTPAPEGTAWATPHRTPGAVPLLAALAPPVACALARPLGSLPLLWDAALVGALGTRAAAVGGRLVGHPLGARALAVPSLRPAPRGTSGAVTGAGTVAAVAAAVVVAAVGTALQLLAPGDAALAAGAATLAALAEGTLADRVPAATRDLVIGLAGAALAAGLVAALP